MTSHGKTRNGITANEDNVLSLAIYYLSAIKGGIAFSKNISGIQIFRGLGNCKWPAV